MLLKNFSSKTTKTLLTLQATPIIVLSIYFVVVFYITQTNSKEQSLIYFNTIKNSFIDTNKKNIQEIIDKIRVEIIYEKNKSLEDFKLKLKENITKLVSSVGNISTNMDISNSEKRKILNILTETFIDEEIGNKYFIYDNKSNTFITDSIPHNLGEFDKIKESIIKNQDVRATVKEENSNIYVSYIFIEKLNLIVGTYADYSIFEEKVKKLIIKKTNKTFLGNYIFIHDHEKFQILAHFKDDVIGEVLTPKKTPQRFKNLQEIKQVSTAGGGFLTYSTEKNNEPGKWETKISYVQSIPDWNWSIGTGFYTDDIEKVLSQKEEQIKKVYDSTIQKLFIISFIILGFFLLFLNFFLLNIKNKFIAYQKLQTFKKGSLKKTLSEKEREVTALEETINSYVIKTTVDSEGLVIYASKEFCRIIDKTKEELKNKTFLEFNFFENEILFDELEKNITEISFEDVKILIDKYETVETITYCYNSSGDKILFETLLFKEKKNYSIIRKNITEQIRNKMLIKRLNKLNSNLENQVAKEVEKNSKKDLILNQQSKLASLGELLGMIAHQWRHPLSNITINTLKLYKKLLEGRLTEDELKPIIGNIEKITKELSNTITNFLNFYKPDFQTQNFKVNCAIENVLKIVFPETYNIKVDFVAKEEIIINGYRSQFQQILLTILVNMLEQFQLNKTKEPHIEILLKKDEESYIVLTIKDNAGGINNEILDIIFEPYTTTKKNKNSGLGLHIAKKIVNQFNGSIKAYNIEDGAKFEIKIRI